MCVCVCPKEFLNTVGILDPTLEVPLDHSSFHLCCPYSGEVLRIGSLQDCLVASYGSLLSSIIRGI